MNHLKYVFIVFLVLVHHSVFAITGSWFTSFQELPQGFMIKELTVYKTGDRFQFILSRLGFNSIRGWEEMRMTGRVSMQENKMELFPVFCQNFAIPSFKQKMSLIRAWECDHLHFQFIPTTGGLLEPSLELTERESFGSFRSEKNGRVAVIVIGDGLLWGNRIQYLYSPGSVHYNGNLLEYDLESQTNSTMLIKTNHLPRGTIVEVENKPAASLF